MKYELNKPINITIYGDSIATTSHGNGGLEGHLKKMFTIGSLDNYAVSGSSLSVINPTNGYTIIKNHPPKPETDLILVWYGSNDWFFGAATGSLSDTAPDSFLGAFGLAVDSLRKSAPTAKIVWLTPLYRKEAPEGFTNTCEAYCFANQSGTTLSDIHQAVISGCRHYGVLVIDMYALCNIHRYNAHMYLEDLAHPNEAGYRIIGGVLCKALYGLVCDCTNGYPTL